MCSLKLENQKPIIHGLYILPVEVKFFSTKNQLNFKLDKEQLVRLQHTCSGNNFVFVVPGYERQNYLYPNTKYFCSIGSDEWSVDFSKLKPYINEN